VIHFSGDKWYWMNDSFPAHNISLRSASQENVVIIDQSDVANVKVIGEMDRFSAMTLLHDEAIYLHQGIQYQVEYLDWDEKKAYVREVDVDYFTDANLAVNLKVLEADKERLEGTYSISYGDVMVSAMATIFKKIKFETHENIGSGPISLPEEELHTNAVWLSFEKEQFHESEERLEQALISVANAIQSIAPLMVMCDPSDLHVVPQIKAVHNEQPTIFLYDRYPGGIGLSDKVYEQMNGVLSQTNQLIVNCSCESGCPSCIGMEAQGEHAKSDALVLLQQLQSR